MALKAMTYEDMPIQKTKVKKNGGLYHYSSFALIAELLKRHKMAIFITGDIILVLNYIFPAWFELVKSVI